MATTTAPIARKTQPADGSAPGPKGVTLLGSVPEMRRKGMIQFYLDAWRTYGDTVRIQTGPLVQHVIARPDDIKHVLLDNKDNYEKGLLALKKLNMVLGSGLFTSEGELWRRQRSIMGPTFTPRAIGQFADAMITSTGRMLRGWEARAADGKPANVNIEMMRLAMSIIARTMFSFDIGRESIEAARAFSYVLENMSKRSASMVDIPLSIPTPANRRFNKSIEILDDFIYGIIDRRMRDPGDKMDLLSILINARDPQTGEGMSRRQLRDEVITIFFAGHETTAQALTWCWYLLAQHPEVETKLHEEVDRVLGGRALTLEDAHGLEYTTMVVQEAMRLYPPVWLYVRQSLGEDELGGYKIPTDSMIILSPYLTHRHPDYWEDPEKFDPERFTPERSAGRHRYAYFPFGGGPRICLGNNFAMLEATIAVAMTAQRFKLRLLPGPEVHPKMVGTMRPDRYIMMSLQPR